MVQLRFRLYNYNAKAKMVLNKFVVASCTVLVEHHKKMLLAQLNKYHTPLDQTMNKMLRLE